MKFDISFQEVDNQALVSFVKANQKRTFVVQRILRNVNGNILRFRQKNGHSGKPGCERWPGRLAGQGFSVDRRASTSV